MRTSRLHILVVAAGLPIVWMLANATGVCLTRASYLTDDTAKRAAVALFITMNEQDRQGAPATSVDDFLRRFPNCCLVNGALEKPGLGPPWRASILDRLFGFGAGYAFIRKSHERETQPAAHFGVTACGRAYFL